MQEFSVKSNFSPRYFQTSCERKLYSVLWLFFRIGFFLSETSEPRQQLMIVFQGQNALYVVDRVLLLIAVMCVIYLGTNINPRHNRLECARTSLHDLLKDFFTGPRISEHLGCFAVHMTQLSFFTYSLRHTTPGYTCYSSPQPFTHLRIFYIVPTKNFYNIFISIA